MESPISQDEVRLAVDDTALLSTYEAVRGQVRAAIFAETSSPPKDSSLLKTAFCSETWPSLHSGYEKLVNEIVRYFRTELGKRKFDCLVLGRVKSAESVQKSLDRREQYRGKSYSGLEDIFGTMHDLAGSLVIVQYARDIETVNSLISQSFRATKPPTHWPCERQPGELWDSQFGSYESHNHHVTLGMMSGSSTITFEVQVTTCSDFMYNRIAHDWFYKKDRGSMSRKDEMEREQENSAESKDQFDLIQATKLAHGVEEWQLQFEIMNSPSHQLKGSDSRTFKENAGFSKTLTTFASVASLLDEAGKTSITLLNTIQTWNDCPSALLALNNEVSEVRLILHQLGITHKSPKARLGLFDKGLMPAIERYVKTTAVHLKLLNTLLDELQESQAFRDKLKLLSGDGNVHRLQTALRKDRHKINDLLLFHNMTNTTKTEVELESVGCIIDERQYKHNSSSALSGKEFHELQEQSLVTRELVAPSQDGNVRREPRSISRPVSGDQFSGAIRHVEHDETQESRPGASNLYVTRKGNRRASGSSKVQPNLTRRADRLPDLHDTTDLKALEAKVWEVLFQSTNHVSSQACAFAVHSQPSNCADKCPCSCHRRRPLESRFSLPPLLRNICGTLFGGYKGDPIVSSRCDRSQCLRQGHMRLRLTYLFPSWFLRRVLHTFINWSQGSITVSLKTCDIRASESFAAFKSAHEGNLQVLEQCLRDDPAGVNAWAVNGSAPLHAAIYVGWVQGVETLLKYGADAYLEGPGNPSAISKASQLILCERLSPSICCRLVELLPVSSYVKDLDLSFLAKVVIGICPISLESILQSHDPLILAQLDSLDESGRTPLHWAAARNDAVASRILIQAGANVNIRTALENYTPLTEAIRCSPADTTILVDTLIDAGADINAVDSYKLTPLTTACFTGNLSIVRKLREAGGGIDAPNPGICAEAPVTIAIYNNRPKILKYLIQEGADINQTNPLLHKTPLTMAIATNTHECFRILLAHGADYLQVDDQGETILHYLARMGHEETIRISKEHGLAGLDLTMRNSSRQTALEVHQLYGSKDPIVSQAFQELLSTMDNTSSGESSSDEDAIFYDVTEEL
ncbi:hypothetical protein PFICI_04339 [Pestalotiopsis fici W106-1]|uniref:RelA/SpoT domain-containing protein n=1 Tax=Pestalotiopsis fici (strain W106-1 / CGMCC3.15140) TaxID=1229662 RepID=W3X8L2_PESFW|nr:uncharacterized protein PFICI_04339 [Pestalotiopsis fici W106-1]ETS82463.1 hypothetical protein PFICI_04339 [Pestalotiopsis fici W106-1]